MKSKLSGFMDGEVDAQDERALLDALKCDDALRNAWSDGCLISDALRGETELGTDIVGRVMAALQNEPSVFVPRPVASMEWQRTALALAATIAGVAVVGWVALGPQQSGQPLTPMASSTSIPLAREHARAETPVPPAALEMQEYLLAHQTQSGSLQFRNGTQYMRTVAITGIAAAK